MAEQISLPIHDRAGAEVDRYEFDPDDLAPRINRQLLHDAVVMYQANRRPGTARTRSRSMVAGNKKKMYRQKGTGRARMGSKRTPIRRGGGHTFAKRTRDYGYRLPRKALRLATRMALLSKFRDGEAVVLESLSCESPKTRAVVETLKALGLYGQQTLVAVEAHDANVYRSARNIERLAITPAADLNALKLLEKKNLIITRAALDRLLGRGEPAAAAA